MKILVSVVPLFALAISAGCDGGTGARFSTAANTDVPAAPAQRLEAPRSGTVTGTVLETQQGALLHVHIRGPDGRRITLVCDRECFPGMGLLQTGKRVRLHWQRRQVRAGDQVFDQDVITLVESR